MENDAIIDTPPNIIRCLNVPAKLLVKSDAKEYFASFGVVRKLIIKPHSRICVVEYEDVDSAEFALNAAGDYENETFHVEPFTRVKKKRVRKEQDPDWTVDPDLQAELDALSNDYGAKRTYNLRPEGMLVDAEVSQTTIPTKKRSSKRLGKSESHSASFKSTNEHSDLINIITQAAFTVEEKYKVLDARDKLIRLKNSKKQIDLVSTKHTVGVCADMCPEKERLMRELQHQVAAYEQTSGEKTMNHILAVKQYSRSSADQEAPLPHDLRHVQALKMTMDYLMHRVMNFSDNSDVNFGEWYHFLWDRTRAIRKDITQQELCCAGSVELVEQCARFHIHCSARLVAEDPSVFDQKINTENLTKCLQTLKYMYNDLALKGVKCPYEGEFRAYVILLNLNDGNFMWEVQQLSRDLQKSPEIRFALNVYSALDNNNYVKFFKLVRASSYLNACILLRYFIQVRAGALRTKLKCYTARSPNVLFPIDELCELLAFEGIASTIDFVEYYGLDVNAERTHVVLNKSNFLLPDVPYILDRAVDVIESKRGARSVGEVVSGGEQLPTTTTLHFETHTLHDSFDTNGHLIINLNDYVGVESASTNSLRVVKERSSSPFVSDSNESWPSSKKDDAAAAAATTPLFTKSTKAKPTDFGGMFSIKTPLHAVKQENPFDAPTMPPSMKHESNNPFNKTQTQMMRFGAFDKNDDSTFNRNIFQTAPSRKHDNNVFPANPFQTAPSVDHADKDQTDSAVEQRASNIFKRRLSSDERADDADVQYKRELEEIRLKRDLELQQKLRQQRFEEEQASKRHAELERQRQLTVQRRRIELQMQEEAAAAAAKRRADEERERALARIELERQRKEKEIICDLMEHLIEQVERNYVANRLKELRERVLVRGALKRWRACIIYKKRKRKAIDQCPLWIATKPIHQTADELFNESQTLTLSLIKRYRQGKSLDVPIHRKQLIQPVDLKRCVTKALILNYTNGKCLHNDIYWKINFFYDSALMETKLNSYIRLERNQSYRLIGEEVMSHNIICCMEKFRIDAATALRFDCNGCIILTLDVTSGFVNRLKSHLERLPRQQHLPLAIITTKSLTSELNELLNNLTRRYSLNLKISIIALNDAQLLHQFDESMKFLSDHNAAIPNLAMNTLKMFLYDNLGTELCQRIKSFAKWNAAYKECLKAPHTAIALYNEALDRLKAIVFDGSIYEFSDFPQIFIDYMPNKLPDCLPCDYKYFPSFWKEEKYKLLLARAFDQFKLPAFPSKWPLDDQVAVEQTLYDYCRSVLHTPDKTFYKIMAYVLNNTIDGVLWTNIIELIALEKIASCDYNLRAPYALKTFLNQLFVVYETSALIDYKTEAWFYLTNPLIRKEIDLCKQLEQLEDADNELSMLSDDDDVDDCDIDAILMKLRSNEADAAAAFDTYKKERSKLEDLKTEMDDLQATIKLQQQIGEKLNAALKMAIENN